MMHSLRRRFSMMRGVNMRKMRNIKTSTLPFIVVRHPFERLVSTFQNKMVDKFNRSTLVKDFHKVFEKINFPNFVKFVLQSSEVNCRNLKHCKLDPHLLPYTVNCAPCNVDYRAVVKLENLAQDLLFIGQMVEVQFEMVVNLNPSSGETSELAKEYFSQIHQQDVEKLNQLYKFDFELFDYDP